MWCFTAKKADLPDNSSKSIDVGGKKIALFNQGGKFYALADSCIHRGGPLGQGHLEDGRVTCPWHAWEFDVKTGACLTMEGTKQTVYPTKVKKGEVFVDL